MYFTGTFNRPQHKETSLSGDEFRRNLLLTVLNGYRHVHVYCVQFDEETVDHFPLLGPKIDDS